MRRLALLFCASLLSLGCGSDGDKGQWDEFWKDLRGDNMEMRGDFGGMRDMENSATTLKAHD
jgi:hypothetical protein